MSNNNDNVIVQAGSTGPDRMERAEEVPDLAVLQQELQYAWTQDQNTYALAGWKEDIRYARWAGQAADGLKHRDRMGAKAMPYDGAPDSRIFLADGVINALVDVLYAAFFGARVKTAPTTARTLTAQQAAEWRAVISWMMHGPLRGSLIDDVEFAAQLTQTLGWCVLHPSWRKEKVMRLQTLTMDQVFAIAQAASQAQPPPPARPQSLLAKLPELVMDPTLEEAAVELFQHFFPNFDKREARKVVRELREEKEAEFPVEVDGPNVPALRVLVPGQHFVVPPESTALPGEERWMAVRCFFSAATLRQRAQEEEWNEAFVDRVVKTAGLSIDEQTVEHAVDENMKDIEVFYVYQRRNSDNGVPGMYCTVISMFVNAEGGKETSDADYGFHRLVNYAHNQYPFIIQQTEVTGLRAMDARGVPEVLMTAQAEMKNSRDLTYVNQQMSVAPPLQKMGTQASKLPPGLAPMGIVNNVNGGEWKWFPPPPSNPEIAFKLMELVRKESEDHFGLPRGDTPPARSQARLGRILSRWLAKWGEALWQLSVLAYQNLSPEELTEILGRKPLLTADLVANQRLLLWFEPRSMDSDWLDDMIKNVIQLLGVDTGGTIDRAKLVSFILAYMDPTLSEEVTLDQAGAKQAMFKEVRDEINSMYVGNKPMLRENDPTAQMKLVFAQQVIAENPQFQQTLKDPRLNPAFAENLKTYLANLQHNYQEMVTSKQQGRLGVSDVGNRPVATGATD